MAQKLYDLFLKAGELGGVKARTRLSVLSKISSTEAKSLPDSAELLAKLEAQFKVIAKEFKGSPGSDQLIKNQTVTVEGGMPLIDKLRRQMSAFSDLTSQRELYKGNLDITLKRVTETLVDAIDVERASIWLYTPNNEGIECRDLFIRSKREHSKGAVLHAKDFPTYFNAIETERTLAANNAHTDPRTSVFSDSYLRPLGINSMLDVPIWVNGEMIGVVCHEHIGDFRKWTTDEETFAYIMGNIVGMTIENIMQEEPA